MAVNINTVYQRVLAIANKEQRGYITPQEFNILANQAQMDLFEQYFYDKNQFGRARGNENVYADPVEIINKKISAFEVFDHTLATYTGGSTNAWVFPTDLYRVINFRNNNKVASKISLKEIHIINTHPTLRPTANRPVYIETPAGFRVYIDSTGTTQEVNAGSNTKIDYIKTPTNVSWGYNVILGKAIYNANTSTNFEMHESEEVNLINRILVLAGISIKNVPLYQAASAEEVKDIQQEKQ